MEFPLFLSQAFLLSSVPCHTRSALSGTWSGEGVTPGLHPSELPQLPSLLELSWPGAAWAWPKLYG